MSENRIKKQNWIEIDQVIEKGWYVLKLDGSSFRNLRVPRISLKTLVKYYDILSAVSQEVFLKFKYIQMCYLIDDEFHFLFNSDDVKEPESKVSKLVVLVTSFVTALINSYITSETIISDQPIQYGKLCYDGRLIKLSFDELSNYFLEISNHGKLFLGNQITGDGIPYLNISISNIVKRAEELNISVEEEHNLLFGRLIDRYGETLLMENFDYEIYCYNLTKQIAKYKSLNKKRN